MRLRIDLICTSNPVIDMNSSYHLASLFYRALQRSNPHLSLELHSTPGFKFFTFSKLMVENREFVIEGDRMHLKNRNTHVFFSSPRNEIAAAVVSGLLEKPEISIGGAEFVLSGIKVMREKEIGEREKFVTLSPVSVTTVVEEGGKKKIWDLFPDEPRFYENVRKNLVRKFRSLHGRDPEDEELEIRVLNAKPKMIRIKDTYHRATEMVFEASGSRELLEMGYKAGFGERNSMGFGMVKAL